MNNKNLIILGVAAVVLGGAAFFLSRGTATRAPALNGQRLVPPFDVEKVAKIEIGSALALVAGDEGWIVPAATNAPAEPINIRLLIIVYHPSHVSPVEMQCHAAATQPPQRHQTRNMRHPPFPQAQQA